MSGNTDDRDAWVVNYQRQREIDRGLTDDELIAKYGQEWFAMWGPTCRAPASPSPPAWKVWAFGLGILLFMILVILWGSWKGRYRSLPKPEAPPARIGQ